MLVRPEIQREVLLPEEAKSLYLQSLALINDALLACGVTEFSIPFSGGGDSGQVDEPELPSTLPPMSNTFTYLRPHCYFEWRTEKTTIAYCYYEGLSLIQALVMLADDVTDDTGLDFSNNEGGQGQIQFTTSGRGLAWNTHVEINFDKPDRRTYDIDGFFSVLGEYPVTQENESV